MRTLLTMSLTILVLGLLGAGFVWSGTYNIGADDPHTRPVHALLTTMRDRSIETRSSDISVPDLTGAELISSGAGNYDAMCAGCHLAPGKNESEMSEGLYPAPPNLVKTPIDNPAEAFWVIKHGIKASGMPAWGKSMEDEYIWGLVAFLRQLPDLDAEEYQQTVVASEGHSHDGRESVGPTAAESPLSAAVHTHADGKQHVHATAAGSPVDTAEALHEALSSADTSKVKVLLDTKVLILESGGAERSWEEYAAHHLKADMDFLKTVTYKLQRQTGDTVGDLAWVASEARMTGTSKDEPVDIQSTETLVLKKAAAGWKVVHIHWSSRPVRQ